VQRLRVDRHAAFEIGQQKVGDCNQRIGVVGGWDEGIAEDAAAAAATETIFAFMEKNRESEGRTNRPGTLSDPGRLNPSRPSSHFRRGAGLATSEANLDGLWA
jgi:hypothetical protein